MSKRTRRQVFKVGVAVTAGILMVALPCLAQQLTNDELSLTVNAHRWDEFYMAPSATTINENGNR